MRLLALTLCLLTSACGSETQSGGAGTGGSAGTGGVGGAQDASSDGEAGAAGGKPCTGPTSNDCASDEYCASAPYTCVMGSSPDGGIYAGPYDGVCTKRPASCPSECLFVCGYDGVAYCNACSAHQAGTEGTIHCPICPELHKPCSTESDCVYGLKCCQFMCPYPTGCGDAAPPVTCEEPDKGQCPVAG